MTPVPARVPSGPGLPPRPGPRPRPGAASARATRPLRREGTGPEGSPRLEVVAGVDARTRPAAAAPAAAPAPTSARRPRTAVVVGAAVVCALMLALAAVHSLLVSNQVRLDALEREVATEQARYASLRLEVAQLEAPDRIVREAQERMGMVAPDTVTYLSPSGAVVAGDGTPGPVVVPGGERPWAAVKPYLGDR